MIGRRRGDESPAPATHRIASFIQGFERLAAGLMMLVVILLAGDIYLTLDARQASVEKKITDAITASSNTLNGTINSKFEELRADVKAELDPVSASATRTLNASTMLLTTVNAKAAGLDVDGLNLTVKTAGTSLAAFATTADTLNGKVAGVDVGALNAIVKQAGTTLDVASATLASTAKPLQESLQQFDAALPDLLDCQVDAEGVGNKSCLADRWADMTSDADRITADARRLVDKYTAPATKWEKFEAAVESFGTMVIYAIAKGGL